MKNIFGGILILIDRPFQVGDKIEVGGYYGEVVNIGLRTVRIVTPDDNLVSIPNGDITNQPVSNANAGEPNCQVVAEVYVPLGTDLNKAKLLALQVATTSQFVYLGKPIAVVIKNEMHQGTPWFKIRIKAYVHDIRNEFAFTTQMTESFFAEAQSQGLISI